MKFFSPWNDPSPVPTVDSYDLKLLPDDPGYSDVVVSDAGYKSVYEQYMAFVVAGATLDAVRSGLYDSDVYSDAELEGTAPVNPINQADFDLVEAQQFRTRVSDLIRQMSSAKAKADAALKPVATPPVVSVPDVSTPPVVPSN
jgi:hypothetical protein